MNEEGHPPFALEFCGNKKLAEVSTGRGGIFKPPQVNNAF
jgi:hypothetical protein